MPQGRRKIPFSAKQKKEQLKAKRQTKSSKFLTRRDSDDDEQEAKCSKIPKPSSNQFRMEKLNFQNNRSAQNITNRFALSFRTETREEIAAMKAKANDPLEKRTASALEVDDVYFKNFDFPVRPKWSYEMSREQLNRNENRYFSEYVKNLSRYSEENHFVSLFELNLETWRQLWRVVELSDILVVVVDARFPTLTFPPSLYTHVTGQLKKPIIIVLNKVDLIDGTLLQGWKDYFHSKYPKITVTCLTSRQPRRPGGNSSDVDEEKLKFDTKNYFDGLMNIYRACASIVGKDLDLTAWEQKILEDSDAPEDNFNYINESNDSDYLEHVKYKNGTLSLGFVGFPNVGKSSLINALKGRKVVSVSKTPGHTKHFQTIYLTRNVRVCDCPGLVFPSSTPKHLQVLTGSYPIAQLREPYLSVKYLAERTDLIKYLSIKFPSYGDTKENENNHETEVEENPWTAMTICEAWALKRGFVTAKAARPDCYRAANHILRRALEGQLPFKTYPPQYFEKSGGVEAEHNDDIHSLDKDDDLSSSSEDETGND